MEVETVQLPHLLRYEDRNSMRHGIETRLPFLDYRLVEAGLSMSTRFKVQDGWTKHVLRRAIADILPESIVWRRDKIGFEAPMDTWFREGGERILSDVADSRIVAEICDRRKLLDDWSRLDSVQKWRHFCMAAWERVFGVDWS